MVIYMWLSIIVISFMGTLAHFLYDITNHNKIVGLFTAVNESTWEHIKIALTPTFLWCLYDGIIYVNNPNYFASKSISLLILILVIPLLFYSYKFVIKKNIVFIDISIFYISIILSQSLFYYVINLKPVDSFFTYISCVLMFIIFGLYMILTLLPFKTFLFKDPKSKKYGFKGHK